MPDSYQQTWLALAAAVGALTTAACRPASDPAAEQSNVANEIASLPPLSIAEPPIERDRLLLAVAQAASAHATGADDLPVQRGLDGQRFEVRLRFGCGGPGGGDTANGWAFDPEKRTLRLRVSPDLSLEDPLARSLAGDTIEAVEGFWLKRPWLLNAACPVVPREAASVSAPPAESRRAPRPEASEARAADEDGDAAVASAAGQRVGVAQFFTPTDSRTGRRAARPYEAVVNVGPDRQLGGQGFDLVVSGRLRALAGGRVIHCAARSPDSPPDCIISADIDRVRIERPDDRDVLADWSG